MNPTLTTKSIVSNNDLSQDMIPETSRFGSRNNEFSFEHLSLRGHASAD